MAVSGPSTTGRKVRYVCATYWNRGAIVCSNGLGADGDIADSAVRRALQDEVLRPPVMSRALTDPVETLRNEQKDGIVLANRNRFTPDAEHRRYMLTLPVAFDRVLTYALPDGHKLLWRPQRDSNPRSLP